MWSFRRRLDTVPKTGLLGPCTLGQAPSALCSRWLDQHRLWQLTWTVDEEWNLNSSRLPKLGPDSWRIMDGADPRWGPNRRDLLPNWDATLSKVGLGNLSLGVGSYHLGLTSWKQNIAEVLGPQQHWRVLGLKVRSHRVAPSWRWSAGSSWGLWSGAIWCRWVSWCCDPQCSKSHWGWRNHKHQTTNLMGRWGGGQKQVTSRHHYTSATNNRWKCYKEVVRSKICSAIIFFFLTWFHNSYIQFPLTAS